MVVLNCILHFSVVSWSSWTSFFSFFEPFGIFLYG
jgi:hypothetical protein